MRPSAPAVAARPSLNRTTALTASSWKRSTCSAALRASDQRIAVESKLPEIAVCPSDEIASARTGPPWPRNCAKADVIPSEESASSAAQIRNAAQRCLRGESIRDPMGCLSSRLQFDRSPERCKGFTGDQPIPETASALDLIVGRDSTLPRQAVDDLRTEYRDELTAMRVRPLRRVTTLLWDARFTLVTTLLAGGVEQERT